MAGGGRESGNLRISLCWLEKNGPALKDELNFIVLTNFGEDTSSEIRSLEHRVLLLVCNAIRYFYGVNCAEGT